jgi:microcystin-dependent protein
MPSPITADDFDPLQWGGNACDAFRELIATNERLNTFFAWFLNDAGEVSDAFIESFYDRMMPIGSILAWPSSSLPGDKWKICDGQAVSRTTYATLFTRIGTTFGAGDGSTTFALPDMQGRAPVGVNPQPLGAAFGELTSTIAESDLPAHAHAITTKKVDEVAFYDSSVARLEVFQVFTSGTDTITTSNPPVGGSGSFSTEEAGESGEDQTGISVVQPSRALYFIIKVA